MLPALKVAPLLLVVAVSGACRSTGVPPAAAPVAGGPASATSQAPGQSAAPRVVQPGSPGAATREVSAADAARPPLPHTQADVDFMQGMIPHHAQALAMTALVPERTTREDVGLLARRIELSQTDEIKLMQEWLRSRGEGVPAPDVEHTHHMSGSEREFMPGMLTAEKMAELAAARGGAFDRLFIESMIRHHEGALIMVNRLFTSRGAALGDDIHIVASHVEADQSIEIRRMRGMLARP